MTHPGEDRRIRSPTDLQSLAYGPEGLIPVVAQDAGSGAVLMLAWANREALEQALASGQMHYWSRSRNELWRKGATSGHVQGVVSLHGDCDGDAVLAVVEQTGPACHTGQATCFGMAWHPTGMPGTSGSPPPSPMADGPHRDDGEVIPLALALGELWSTLERRARERPEGSYTARLLDNENLRLKKLGEETAELVTALAKGGPPERICEEGADLLYHLLVALLAAGTTPEELAAELERRRR